MHPHFLTYPALLAGLLLGIGSPVRTGAAEAGFSFNIMLPVRNALAGDALQMGVQIGSTFELREVKATVEGRSAPLHFDPAGIPFRGLPMAGWVGTVPLDGLPRGPLVVTVSATDALGNRGEAAQGFIHDAPPRVFLELPADQTVGTPLVRVVASATDDDPAGCRIRVTVQESFGTTVLAEAQDRIDQDVSIARYYGGGFHLRIEAEDSAGQKTAERRIVYSEISPRLVEVETTVGGIWDVTPDRMLSLDQRTDRGVLHLRDRRTGADRIVFDEYKRRPQYGFVTPNGALFVEQADSGGPVRLLEDRDGTRLELGSPNSSQSLRVHGDFALWSEGSQLVLRDLRAGKNQTIPAAAGNIGNDLGPDGAVAFWDTGYQIRRYHQGVLEVLTDHPGFLNTYPRTDGRRVAYRKSASVAGESRTGIYLHDGTQELPLVPLTARFEFGMMSGYQVQGGWVAYLRPGSAGQHQVWLRGPDGTETQLTFFGSSSALEALATDGSVMFQHGGYRHWARPGGPSLEVSSGLGNAFVLDGAWWVRLGRSLFRVQTDTAPPPSAPSLVLPPAAQSVVLGQPVTLSVEAAGTAPLAYQWFKDGALLPEATSPTLAFAAVRVADAGAYSVRVSNAAGDVTSTPVALDVLVPPTVTVPPTAVAVIEGGPASFFVQATGTAPLAYQWFKDTTLLPDATSPTLAFAAVRVADAGAYSVRVSNAAGDVTSTPVALDVLVPPTVTVPPTAVAVIEGGPASFFVQATGTAPLAYQWFKDTTLLPDATSPTLAFAAVRVADAGAYSVRVSNAAGDVTSTPVALDVLVPPTVTVPPTAVAVVEGGPASFFVQATGTAPLAYQWFKDTTLLPEATSPTLAFAAVRVADAGAYSVRVSNAAGDVTSTPVALDVLVPPTVTVPPTAVAVVEGGPASFFVQATGTAPLAYQWFKDTALLPDATSPTLAFATVRVADAGAYSVRVSNAAGDVTSAPVALDVLVPPTVTVPPTALTVVEGGPASFFVQATGTAPLAYQWFKDTTLLPDATSPTLAFATVRVADAGTYSVRVSNAAGDVTSAPVALDVLVPPTVTVPPTAVAVIEGGPASFFVQATGTAPLAYQWFKDTTLLPDATSPTLAFAAVRVADAGAYSVRVSNAAGDVTSTPVALDVLVPPTVTVPPTALTVVEGGPASFFVQATGTAPLTYQWFKDTALLPEATSPTLAFAAVRVADAGAYSVRVSNAAGDVTSTPVALDVLVPPTVTVPPTALTVVEGGPASFFVQATGTAPLTYQWFKDTTLLPDATSPTLAFAAVRVADAGAYSVRVSNAAGDVTSAPVALDVLVPPTVTVPPTALAVVEGGPASFFVQATGTAPLTYQWFKDTALLPEATSPTLAFAAVRLADAGAYSVRVSNAAGDVTSTPVALDVFVPPTVTVPPTALAVVEGGPASFFVQATGTAPLAYQWFKDTTLLPDATSPTLAFATVRVADAGTYSVRVSNAAGDVTSTPVALDVLVPPTVTVPPTAVAVVEGGPASFFVQATGTAPLTYQWFKDTTLLPDATSPTLAFTAVRVADAGAYSVRVSNAAGDITSTPVALDVLVPPTVTVPPTALTVVEGGPASFFVQATGTAPLTYQWFKDTALLPEATSPTLAFAAVRVADAGAYSVRVSNAAGDVTSAPVALDVLVPPTVTVPPTALAVVEGGPASFFVQATGTAPLAYQWFKDTTLLPDATSPTLAFATVRVADAGTYSVRVSNAAGDVTSTPVALDVLVPPTVTVPPTAVAVVEGGPASFFVQATGTAPLAYQWFKDTTLLPEATSPTLAFAAVRVADAGTYSVRVSNAAGERVSGPVRMEVGVRIGLTPGSTDGTWLLQLPAFAGMTYRLEAAESASEGPWQTVTEGVAEGDVVLVPIPTGPGAPRNRFFRATTAAIGNPPGGSLRAAGPGEAR